MFLDCADLWVETRFCRAARIALKRRHLCDAARNTNGTAPRANETFEKVNNELLLPFIPREWKTITYLVIYTLKGEIYHLLDHFHPLFFRFSWSGLTTAFLSLVKPCCINHAIFFFADHISLLFSRYLLDLVRSGDYSFHSLSQQGTTLRCTKQDETRPAFAGAEKMVLEALGVQQTRRVRVVTIFEQVAALRAAFNNHGGGCEVGNLNKPFSRRHWIGISENGQNTFITQVI